MAGVFSPTAFPELFDLPLWERATTERLLSIASTVHGQLVGGFDLEAPERFAGSTFPIFGLRHRKTGIVFSLVPGGSCLMGLAPEEASRLGALDVNGHLSAIDYFPRAMLPAHEVRVPPLLVSRLPLTEQVAGRYATLRDNPGRPDFDGEPHAPIYLDFDEASSVLAATRFRMLSESECEYVTRAGRQDLFYFGDVLPGRAALARICTSDFEAVADDGLGCNRFGLFGLAVGSFCSDVWHHSYAGAPSDGSSWQADGLGTVHVVRGGATSMWPWHDAGEWLTLVSAMRLRSDYMYEEMAGLRLACSLDEAAALA